MGNREKVLGFIINPIAGLGGPAGFKGTDRPEIVEEALKMGIEPRAPSRGFIALQRLSKLDIKIVTPPREMGYDIASKIFPSNYIELVKLDLPKRTSAVHTKKAAREMLERDVDLLVFVGGDGTAKDILDAVGTNIPTLGVPAGVKIFSAVFGVTPSHSGDVARKFLLEGLPLKLAEVVDVDEDAYRSNQLVIKLYGYLKVPYEPSLLQSSKQPSPLTEGEELSRQAIAKYVVEMMKPGVLYILGPGLTVSEVAKQLGLQKTLLGVDVVLNRQLIASDVNEIKLNDLVSKHNGPIKLILSPLGGSGMLLGRGNQQIGDAVLSRINKRDLIILATPSKLRGLKSLKLDIRGELARKFVGYHRVITGYKEEEVVLIE
ncbi:MAG: ATP-NAD kinase [Thermoproteota archaeon]|nr:MAG: ATP-NAD kinase [Candidatus Korarchaeota archaeon]RLG54387.1 MAG: ATP-NAD kinase [Candidatus Korarchaeota archaeon]